MAHLGVLQFVRGMRAPFRTFLWLSVPIDIAYYGIYLVGFNLYLRRLGFDADFIGIALASGILIETLSFAAAGRLERRFSIRGYLLCGQSVVLLALTAIALTHLTPRAWWTVWILCANGLAWFGGAIYYVARAPYMVAITTAEERAAAFALENIVVAVAAFVGSLVFSGLPVVLAAMFAIDRDSVEAIGYALLAGPVIMAVGVWRFMRGTTTTARDQPDEPAHEPAAERRRPSRVVLWLVVVGGFLMFGDASPRYFFNDYMDTSFGASVAVIGATMAAARLVVIVPMALLPRLAGRFRHDQLLGFAAIAFTFVMVPFALVRQVAVAGVCYLVLSMLLNLLHTVFEIHRMEVLPEKDRASGNGIVLTTMSLGHALSSATGGFVIDRAGYAPYFLVGAAMMLATAPALAALTRAVRASRV